MSDNPEALREARARYRHYNYESGLCVKCPSPRSPWSAIFCERHAEKQRQYVRKHDRLKSNRDEREGDRAALRQLRSRAKARRRGEPVPEVTRCKNTNRD